MKGRLKHWRLDLLAVLLILHPFVSGAQQNNSKVQQLLAQSGILWKQYSSQHFRYFVQEKGFAAGRIDTVKNEMEGYRAALIPFFQHADTLNDKTDIIIYETEEQIKRALGWVVQGFAISEHKVLVFVHNQRYKLAARHELAHYYAFHLWGREADNGFSEGLAVYLDKYWSNYPIDPLTRHLKNENRLIRLPALMKNFFKYDPMIAYPEIGSFTGFLLERYGKEKLHQTWQQGFKQASKIYGIDLAGLEKEWLTWLDQFNADQIDYSRYLKKVQKK